MFSATFQPNWLQMYWCSGSAIARCICGQTVEQIQLHQNLPMTLLVRRYYGLFSEYDWKNKNATGFLTVVHKFLTGVFSAVFQI